MSSGSLPYVSTTTFIKSVKPNQDKEFDTNMKCVEDFNIDYDKILMDGFSDKVLF